ncbi:hypothetical protein K0B96_03610 [Horticoccus luteus]|uniref:Uncharacterized protein n=1 Tax=Horticoccus luteus TaxID=2862869 RepID=A0A8F9XM62_9BACT|nr:hypothetical protein [Horticoccus luteus]QYM79719.1 hypothetical protein K0B96_03610 [Horticoccus luteus]
MILALFRSPTSPRVERGQAGPSQTKSEKTGIDLTRLQPGESGALEQQAVLGDPTPLFLPTDWNYGQGVLPQSVVREPGQQFRTFAPKFAYGEADLTLRLPLSVEIPASGVVALTTVMKNSLSGFGRSDGAAPDLAARAAYVEVCRMEDGARVWEAAVADAEPPGARFWQPAEFMVAVDAAGLIGPPVQTVRTGVDDVDRYLKRYLSAGVHIGARLTPGLYRVAIGP